MRSLFTFLCLVSFLTAQEAKLPPKEQFHLFLLVGQSNMAGSVRTFRGKDEGLQKALAAAPYPRIRLIKQGGAGWQLATTANVDGFSANLFAFGSRLHAEPLRPLASRTQPQ